MKKKYIAVITVLLLTTACDRLDVIGRGSVKSFEDIVELKGVTWMGGDWIISAPDGQARFMLPYDYDGSGLRIAFDAAPFIKAGLDLEKLEHILYENGYLVAGKLHDSNRPAINPEGVDVVDSYRRLLKREPSVIGYHDSLDHYGVELGNGNMFEWAKDTTANDKDIVYVLNPQPFIEAGTDVTRIDGWLYGQVEIMDGRKKVLAYKLLKPFDLDGMPE